MSVSLSRTAHKPPGLSSTSATENKKSAAAVQGSVTALSARLKVVVRRLAPGLTQQEFETAIGEEWKLGNGRVDWLLYKPGKPSRDLAKPSRPSRAYLHLTGQQHLEPFAEKIRQTSFLDARNSASDVVLIAPPTLEFAPYGRVPGGKRRTDARQGQIDQDAEFIEFLESLTNPITKPPAPVVDSDAVGKPPDKTVTPLIQHLRDKKAAREKASVVKALKKGPDTKVEAIDPKALPRDGAAKDRPASSKNNTVVINKKLAARSSRSDQSPVAEIVKKEAQPPSIKPSTVKQTPAVTTQVPARRPRANAPGNAAAAARIIQRDLGLQAHNEGGRRGRNPASPVTADLKATVRPQPLSEASNKSSTTPSATSLKAKSTTPSVRSEDSASVAHSAKIELVKTVSNTVPSAKPPPPMPTAPPTSAAPMILKANLPTGKAPRASTLALPSSTATSAFLKHANPSQGITESLIATAMRAFGDVQRVEIDKRKGFAYVEFTNPNGLRAAIAAGTVPVAQGSVQVLELKDRSSSRAASGSAATAVTQHQTQGHPPDQVHAQTGSVRGGRGGPTQGQPQSRGGTMRGRGKGGQTRGPASATATVASSLSSGSGSAVPAPASASASTTTMSPSVINAKDTTEHNA